VIQKPKVPRPQQVIQSVDDKIEQIKKSSISDMPPHMSIRMKDGRINQVQNKKLLGAYRTKLRQLGLKVSNTATGKTINNIINEAKKEEKEKANPEPIKPPARPVKRSSSRLAQKSQQASKPDSKPDSKPASKQPSKAPSKTQSKPASKSKKEVKDKSKAKQVVSNIPVDDLETSGMAEDLDITDDSDEFRPASQVFSSSSRGQFQAPLFKGQQPPAQQQRRQGIY